VWASYAVLTVFLAGYLASLIIRQGDENWTWFDGWAVCGAEILASVLCLGRAVFWPRRRFVALALGIATLSWSIGDVVLTIESLGNASPPSPSLADLFYLGFYPFAYIAILLFIADGTQKLPRSTWLDGAIAGLGAAAACAAFAFQAIVSSTGETIPATMANLAYPIGDVLLLGLVVGGFVALQGRRESAWMMLAAGMALNIVGDTSNLFQNSIGASQFGVILNAIAWPTAIVLMSLAMWVPKRPTGLLERESRGKSSWAFVLPNAAAVSALAVLLVGSLHSVSRVAIGLAAATLVAVGIRLALSVHDMQALSQERHRQSVTDELTGLHNRRYLFRVLEAFFAEAKHHDPEARSLAFLFVDLNRFKEINDSFGHPAGDALLKQLGVRLSGAIRESDLPVRLGGDEFAVLLTDADLDEAKVVAERLAASLEQPFVLDVVTATIGASIGIAMAPTDAIDPAGLVWCADVAMYRAKLSRVPVASYEQTLDLERDQMRLLEELHVAIDEDQLVLHYQPQLDLRNGEILSVEALIRWAHPRLGLLAPVKFLPAAEEAGLMPRITQWVFDEASCQCRDWRQSGRRVSISVNVSASTLLEPGFVSMVRDSLARHGVPGEALVVEITEARVISEIDAARTVIEELQGLGVVVSIDDFGAGVTSLAYLSNLSVGELKLDRSFIAGLVSGDRERDLDLVRSTIELGHALGLRIVAEGIEDAATLQLLARLGCDYGQGYCISKPKPAHELAFRYEMAA